MGAPFSPNNSLSVLGRGIGMEKVMVNASRGGGTQDVPLKVSGESNWKFGYFELECDKGECGGEHP